MKKFISIALSALICLSMAGCRANSLNSIVSNTTSNSKEELISKAVSKYYLVQDPKNKGELKIYTTKSFKDKYLILAEKYSGDGHRLINLFLIDGDYNITAWASGETPISMCFSINKVNYNGSTILFGTFNNSKWDSKQDRKIPVQINKLDIKFGNSQNIIENVSTDSGYIVISNSASKIEQFNLYNDKNELQSNLVELEKVVETELNELKDK